MSNKDILRDTLVSLVDSSWKNNYEPEYILYDKELPHCDDALSYKAVNKHIRFRCKHDIKGL